MSIQRDLMRQTRESGLALVFNILSGLLTAVTVILQAWIVSQVIQQVFLNRSTLEDVIPALWQIAGLILFRAGLSISSEVSGKLIAIRVKANLREALLAKANRLGPVYTAGEKRGEMIHTIFEGIEALDAYFSQYLPQVVLAGLIPLAILIAVFPREPLSGVILLVTAPLIPVFMALIGIMSEQRTKKQWKLLTHLSTHFYDTLQGLELLKQLNQDENRANQVETTDMAYRQATMQVLKYTFLSAMALELVATISTAIVAVEIGIRLLYGKMAYQPALFILILTPEFYLPLRQLSVRYHAAMSGVQAANSIFRFLAEPETANPAGSSFAPADSSKTETPLDIFPIHFEHVSARYPGSDKDVIKDVSFYIEQGSHQALVGVSGVGKTTLFSLLLRFLPITQGKILANGTPIDQIPVENWLSRIAWVPQTPYIFNDTILNNIILNDPEPDENRWIESVQAAGLWDWIYSLPEGRHTRTGERGAVISSGQAQRIAIARAYYKQADLILLDEPTSAVDPILEKQLQQSTQNLERSRTTLTIAHRLPTIYRSDRIFLLDDGTLVEQGSHIDLLELNGSYSQFVRRYMHASG